MEAGEQPATSEAAEAAAPGLVPKGRWRVSRDRSKVGFKAKKAGLYFVKGKFTGVEGWIEVPDDPSATRGELVVEARTISTRMLPRDWHLRTSDFLDVKRYPELRISAERIEPAEAGDFKLSATFEIHGERRPVELTARLDRPEGGAAEDLGLHLRGVLDRKDFGIRAPWHSEWLVGDEIHLDVELGLERAS